MWETCVRSLSWEDPLEKGMATHSSIQYTTHSSIQSHNCSLDAEMSKFTGHLSDLWGQCIEFLKIKKFLKI